MEKKLLIIGIAVIIIIAVVGTVLFLNLSKSPCNEKKIILEGKLEIVHSKYPIDVITTLDRTYWMYGSPVNFKENLNKTVRIEAILSPSYSQDIECNICYRQCNTCQCPIDEELLYDVKILEVLE